MINDWIEKHPVLIDIIKWIVGLAIAWAAGVFRFLAKITQKPKLDLCEQACFCYLENNEKNSLAVFIVNPTIKNFSDRDFEIDRFYLGYECPASSKSLKQKYLHIPFPSRPIKKVGNSHKVLAVFLTRYNDKLDDIMTVSKKVLPRSASAGYLMFVSNTWGTWKPSIKNGTVKIRLTVSTIGEGVLRKEAKLVIVNRTSLDKFCPELYNHIKCENVQQQELNG